jgi:hypothetical protein
MANKTSAGSIDSDGEVATDMIDNQKGSLVRSSGDKAALTGGNRPRPSRVRVTSVTSDVHVMSGASTKTESGVLT